MDYYMSCDSGGLYVHKTSEPGPPHQITACTVGDRLAMAADTATKRIAVYKNGIAEGWLPGPIPATLQV
jgi:hypothetical protein